ncbi:isocitrate lyase/PEP mutase family protein [Nocardioides ferulae]|uniref:isocitrate lyase/PEP mutase family protein n=1 Tax=Nocardioides ferulae TaxID=2340821 RepID=UPI000EB0789F|nr:isocitrate lyase/phosphoenolpyruvate mutase family protein [Nocardioides ferulae]
MDATDPPEVTGFFELHRPGDPFVLPNAWDVGSARALVAEGFPAVGTTSLGVAAARGLPDATRAAHDAVLAVTGELLAAGLGVPLTVDLEDGFSDDPGAVADLVVGLGVAGVNLEDATDGALIDPDRHAHRIAAVKQRAPGVFVNARTDVFWVGDHDPGEAIARLRRYVDAGADGVFVPGALDEATIESLTAAVGAPLNVLASPAIPRTRLAELGVARISTGSLLYRSALGQAVAAARAVRDGAPLPAAPSYAEVQRLATGSG